jgi:hypothetical protein
MILWEPIRRFPGAPAVESGSPLDPKIINLLAHFELGDQPARLPAAT